MVSGHPDNPNTSFDGIAREPTNAEMAQGWRQFLAYSWLGLVWLWIEWALLLQDWALPLLNHGAAAWALAAMVTWRRPILWALASLVLAMIVGVRAFIEAFSAELRSA